MVSDMPFRVTMRNRQFPFMPVPIMPDAVGGLRGSTLQADLHMRQPGLRQRQDFGFIQQYG